MFEIFPYVALYKFDKKSNLTAIKLKIATFSLLYVFVGKLFSALVENHFGQCIIS